MILGRDGQAPSVMVVVPSYDGWEGPTVTSFIGMMMFTHEQIHEFITTDGESGFPIGRMSIQQTEGTYLHRGREILAETALERGFDYVLWVDTDMTFPADSLIKLLSTGEKIVGANYCRRKWDELGYTAIKRVFETVDQKSQNCVTGPESTGIEEVEGIGFGLCLTHTSVFEDVPKPWFWYHWLPDLQQHVGEDIYFCAKAREAGHSVWVDHDLSKHVGHIGTFKYTNQHAWEALPEEDLVPTVDRRLEVVSR